MVNSLAFVIFLKVTSWFEKYLKLYPNPLLLLIWTSQELENKTNYDKNENWLGATYATVDKSIQVLLVCLLQY